MFPSRSRLAILAAFAALATILTTLPPANAAPAPAQRDGVFAEFNTGSARAQVRRLFIAVFNREPDRGGLEFWADLRTSGTSLEVVAQEFTASQEFQNTYGSLNNVQFIEALYPNLFGRPADEEGRDFWVALLDGGVSRGAVVASISEAPEFVNATADLSDFPIVDRLYCAFFLRQADTGGRAFWNGLYLDGTSLAAIATEFTVQPEFANTYGELNNREFVELIYQNVLGRPLPLTETEGPTFWTGVLARGVTRGAVMIEFSEAQEYLNRFANEVLTAEGCPAPGDADPSAQDDTATAFAATPVTINVTANDALLDGAAISAVQSTTANGGTVVNNGDGTVTYTPNASFAGTDTFTYTIADNDTPPETATATVTVTVLPADADGVPIANDDVATTSAGLAVEINWAANDVVEPPTGPEEGNLVDLDGVTQPANGSVSPNADNTFTYTPNSGFVGVDTFSYTLADQEGDTSTATVTVTVTAGQSTNDRAVDDQTLTQVDTPVSINVIANDDLSGATDVAVIETSQPAHGVVTIGEGGVVQYVPEAGYEAETTQRRFVDDTFTYTVSMTVNGQLEVSTAVVSVVVTSTPRCEVFMNYPDNSSGTANFSRIELFFSNRACFEVYPTSPAKTVVWENVTINGAGVATTSGTDDQGQPTELREYAPVSITNPTNGQKLILSGTAVLNASGGRAIELPFAVEWVFNGTTWQRDNSTYVGKDATVLIDPFT